MSEAYILEQQARYANCRKRCNKLQLDDNLEIVGVPMRRTRTWPVRVSHSITFVLGTSAERRLSTALRSRASAPLLFS